jgi:peptidoglycan/xylan/chitin deacetylase (PgdA/CDA1 family)
MDQTCKNHPDRKAKKKCSHCHQYVCPECQWILQKKVYCGIYCYIKAHLFSVTRSTKPAKTAKSKKAAPPSWPGLITAAAYLLVLISLLALWHSNHTLKDQVRSLRDSIKTQSDLTRSSYPWCDSTNFNVTPVPKTMVESNTIDIDGSAPDGIIVTLKIDNKLKAVSMSKDGHFGFNNVELHYGSNEIVVQALSEEGKPLVLEKMLTVYGAPSVTYLSHSFTRGNIQEPDIALTFDGGSGDGAASDILDYLKSSNLHCTIFLTGEFLKRYPLVVQRIVADGHEIGNHTWSHPHLTTYNQNRQHNTFPGMTREKLQSELKRTADFFYNLTGRRMKPYWRAPYGEHNAEIRAWAAEIGYTHVGWTGGNGENMDTLDWVADSTQSIYKSSHEILQKLLSFGGGERSAANGGIILMHLDTNRQRDPAHKIIPELINSMQSRGYRFVTISDMMSEGQ